MNYKVFDPFLDSVVVVNNDYKAVYCNQAFANLCGLSIRKVKSAKVLSDVFLIEDEDINDLSKLRDYSKVSMYKEVNFKSSLGNSGTIQFHVQNSESEGEHIIYVRDVSLEKILHNKYRGEIDKKEEVISQLKVAQEELKDYSVNLEEKVQERTEELAESYKLQSAMLNSVKQGFFILKADNRVMDQYSSICKSWFGDHFAEKTFSDFIGLEDETKRTEVTTWIDAVFQDLIPFEDVVGLCPIDEIRIGDVDIKFNFYSMSSQDSNLEGLVVVAEDITEQKRIISELDREKSFAQMLTKVLEHRNQFQSFVHESQEFFKQAQEDPDYITKDAGITLMRQLHTVKGGAASFRLYDLEHETHSLEENLTELDCAHLDDFQLKGLVRNVKILENTLNETVNTVRLWLQMPDLEEERKIILSVSDIQKWYESLILHEQSQAFAKLLRDEYLCVRIEDSLSYLCAEAERVARTTGKFLAPVEIKGGDVKIYPEHYSGLFSALVHSVRNSVDHGLEFPDKRTGLGKEEAGNIQISVDQTTDEDSSWLHIEIADDGKGVDVESLRAKLPEEEQTSKTDEEILDLIFKDGISTSEEVSETSGRGIGMASIRFEAEKLGGKAWIESEAGMGTKLSIKVPLVRELSAQPKEKQSA